MSGFDNDTRCLLNFVSVCRTAVCTVATYMLSRFGGLSLVLRCVVMVHARAAGRRIPEVKTEHRG